AGFGRTGEWWGIDHWQVRPDILVTSKGAAGGYFPFGFVAARGDDVQLIYETLGEFNHGGTFSHHAVGAAAALATLHIIQRENLVANAQRVGAYLGEALRHTFSEHPHVGDIRGRGLFWALELVQDRETKRPFTAAEKVAPRLHQAAFDLGLIVYYSQCCADGKNGDVIMLGPPLTTTEPQVNEMLALLAKAITQQLGS
ncbi:MAG: aspartate aminotransferase family protein, partial [Anaerolineales bacterium]|nr:aspartate aminotransferase family protein [Anaerolineales bacterium]